MITLLTGVPGMGKTSYIVDMLLKNDASEDPRPVFVMGIPDLKIDYSPVPPVEEWTEPRPNPEDPSKIMHHFVFPKNAIIVIDECQRVYRSRTRTGEPPSHVSALETHRHEGIDFFLLTQKPRQVDQAVLELVGRHIHLYNSLLGRKLYEWNEYNDPNSKTNRQDAIRRSYKPSKQTFNYYKSAEVHTKQPRRVHQVFFLLAAAISMTVFMGYKVYGSVMEKKNYIDNVNSGLAVNDKPSKITPSDNKSNIIPATLSPEKTTQTDIPKKVVHPYMDYEFFISGVVQSKSFNRVYFQLEQGSKIVFINNQDLEALGYQIKVVGDCSAFLFFNGAQITASCKSPSQRPENVIQASSDSI